MVPPMPSNFKFSRHAKREQSLKVGKVVYQRQLHIYHAFKVNPFFF